MGVKGKFSIIVPVYNGAQYLQRCLASILCQSYSKYEVIIIDDGSVDNTYELANEIAALDARVKVYHFENSGVSSARNRGIQTASGEYITFVDVDDEMEPFALEKIATAFKVEEPDVVIFGWKRQTRDKDIEIAVTDKTVVVSSPEEIIKSILSNYSNCGGGYPWNKVWKISKPEAVELFDPKLSYFEDLEWVVRMLNRTKKVVLLPECLYCYNVNENGVTLRTDRRERNELDYHKSIQCVIKDLEHNLALKKWFVEKYSPEIPNGIIHAKRLGWLSVERYLMSLLHQYMDSFSITSKNPIKTKLRFWKLFFVERICR